MPAERRLAGGHIAAGMSNAWNGSFPRRKSGKEYFAFE
jgi:hypothetical protein